MALKDDAPLDYDYLVLAPGSVSNDFGIPGLTQYSTSLKELSDALKIHQKMHQLLGECHRDQKPLHIFIGGGGIAGIETASELQHYIDQRCRNHHHPKDFISVTILEAAPTILPGMPAWVQQATIKRLQNLGATISTNQPIVGVDAKTISLKDGSKLPYDFFVWTGGIKAHPLVSNLGVQCAGSKQQVCVEPTLQVPQHPEVYAIGDNISFIDPATKHPVPQVAQLAVAQGQHAAMNIHRQILHQPLVPYQPDHSGFVFPVGGRWAISTVYGMKLTGWWAWILRKIVDLKYYLSILPFGQAFQVWWQGERAYLQND